MSVDEFILNVAKAEAHKLLEDGGQKALSSKSFVKEEKYHRHFSVAYTIVSRNIIIYCSC